jgi:ADP-dependent NAD(P)H-hydrate dehydratase / NAD(P)H-hydrate epimerase
MPTEIKLNELRHLISAPTGSDHKYSRGVLTVIAGSQNFPGAAVLNCEAAIRIGTGMIRFLGDAQASKEVLQQRPEVVFAEGESDAFAVGSGLDPTSLSQTVLTRIQTALDSQKPIVVDAGALNLFQRGHSLQLLTPHAGELAKLFEQVSITVSALEISQSPEYYAKLAAMEFETLVLLKGNITYIASNLTPFVFSISELPTWLATAGSGDVLTGIIAGLAAQHQQMNTMKFQELAALGVLIHGAAANLASSGGPIAALDIAAKLPAVIAGLL